MTNPFSSLTFEVCEGFKCPNYSHKPYIYLQSLLSHPSNVHRMSNFEINQFAASLGSVNTPKASCFKCSFCDRTCKGQKWLDNHISFTHSKYFVHLLFFLKT